MQEREKLRPLMITLILEELFLILNLKLNLQVSTERLSTETEKLNIAILNYCKDTEPLYHSFIYSFGSLLSGLYTLPATHSLLVTLCVTEFKWH